MSSYINDGGPAFPTYESNGEGHRYCSGAGMSLRDYFAARASDADVAPWMFGPVCLQIKTASDGSKYEYHGPAEYTREQARYRFADAMLAARLG
jgi:hypothetical protein